MRFRGKGHFPWCRIFFEMQGEIMERIFFSRRRMSLRSLREIGEKGLCYVQLLSENWECFLMMNVKYCEEILSSVWIK